MNKHAIKHSVLYKGVQEQGTLLNCTLFQLHPTLIQAEVEISRLDRGLFGLIILTDYKMAC